MSMDQIAHLRKSSNVNFFFYFLGFLNLNF